MNQTQSEKQLASWLRRDPFIRIGGRKGEARTHVGKTSHFTIHRPTHRGKATGKLDRRKPGFEKIGAKGEEKLCLGQVVHRNSVTIKADPVGSAQGLVGERLIADDPFRAESPQPISNKTIETPCEKGGDKTDLMP